MPRIARVVVPGSAHHVTQRGNNRQAVFFTDDDRRVYLQLLRDQGRRFDLRFRGYCLMSNHVHLLVVPQHGESLAKALGSANLLYTRYINRLHGRSGHLWQNRFFSCPVDGEYELAALRYTERNPRRARMVRLPWLYRWSSAAAHCGERQDEFGVLDLQWWRGRFTNRQWKAILQDPQDEAEITHLRSASFNGRPLGTDRFMSKVEAKLNRRLRVRPRGRPRKATRRPQVRPVGTQGASS